MASVLNARIKREDKPNTEKLRATILRNLRVDVQDGSLFVRHLTPILPDGLISATSDGAFAKKNTDRAIPATIRVISDIRRINIAIRKSEGPPPPVAMKPTIEKILRR